MENRKKLTEVLEISDSVRGRKVSARFGPNCTGIYAQVGEPLAIIPMMHALEYSYSQGFSPSRVEMRELEDPSGSIDISEEKPGWKVCVVLYKRDGVDQDSLLNAYNRFLAREFREFPSNLLIKAANRDELRSLYPDADYREDGMLFFSSPSGERRDLSSLGNYPIQYKMRK